MSNPFERMQHQTLLWAIDKLKFTAYDFMSVHDPGIISQNACQPIINILLDFLH